MNVTLKDIAKLCGVSVATVSLVLNNKPNRISEATKQKILEKAKELHYHPNPMALSLVTRKSKVLGLIIPDVTNLFFTDFLRQVEIEAAKFGYTIILGNTDEQGSREYEYVRTFLQRGLAGCILIHSSIEMDKYDAKIVDLVKQSKLPFILIDRHQKANNIRTLFIDQKLGAYLATTHLLNLGHTRIGYISGPLDLDLSRMRYDGYRQALEDHGIVFDENLIEFGDWRADGGHHAGLRLIAKGVSSIFAANDMMAFGVYQAAFSMALRIPQDLSVIGFDDVSFASVVTPGLTTIHQPMSQVGIDCVGMLVDMIEARKTTETSKQYSPTLIVRGSTLKK
ncbi:MAG: LacI family transcriptional regulator [Firmicutes bacterium HGW-Firmicutes-20]|jgi:LacI family transcriptional regulator|nr:MAG: LacI family transcriptional regulator [Firmicutes bacterium HGW-Firmicutes-20]PKM68223.1 MAG: LacI family transcriptional regulator [Firmicutes bacterium HGW-Firmicutes-19]